jgi:hypothetical protein
MVSRRFLRIEDGHVHYQDKFGRTEKQRDFLRKDPPVRPLRPGDSCGCGSGLPFKECCKPRPIALRPTWNEPSIRERNLMLYNGIVGVLGLDQGKDWVKVRRELTDEKISRIYLLYEALWPLETNLFQLLPKADGIARAVYTGSIHPTTITEFARSVSLLRRVDHRAPLHTCGNGQKGVCSYVAQWNRSASVTPGTQFRKGLESLRCQLARKNRYPGGVSTGSSKACDVSKSDWIIAAKKCDWYRRGRRLGRGNGRSICDNHRYPTTD